MTVLLSVTVLTVLALCGLLLALWADVHRDDPVSLLGLSVTAGLALPVVGFWFLRTVPLHWSALIWLPAALIVGAYVLWPAAREGALTTWRRLGPAPRALWFVVLLIALIRFMPMVLAPVSPGADMSMHSYMARLIATAAGVPSSHHPLLPIDDFGAYAAGLPTLGAVLNLWGTPSGVAGSVFLVNCLTYLLLTLVIYAWVRAVASPFAAASAATLVTLAARDPQAFFVWGGTPTVLSLVFTVCALIVVERLLDPAHRSRWLGMIPLCAVCLAAAPLTHAVIPYACVYLLPPLLVWRLLRHPRPTEAVTRGLVILALAGVFLVPYLAEMNLVLSQFERDWILAWQRLPSHVPPGPPWLLPLSSFFHAARRLGPYLTVWIVGLLLMRWRGERVPITEDVLLFVGVLLLVANALFWVLPASYAIYPDRVMLFALLPLSRILGRIIPDLPSRPRRWSAAIALTALVPVSLFYLLGVSKISVTRNDVKVIAWIAENTPDGAVIESNYGDAGAWIPALAGRAVRSPHANVIYLSDIERWQRTVTPTVIFIGEKMVYPNDETRTARSEGVGERLFSVGDAAVYEWAAPAVE